MQPSHFDLFAGAGGLSLGLEQAGFRCAFADDNWTPACQTFQSNFPHVPLVQADASDLDASSILDAAASKQSPLLVTGGPPCQGFTSAGPRRVGDVRNNLVAEFSRLVVQLLPEWVLFENVEGFLTLDKGRFVLDLITPLVETGYWIRLRKINVANYGIPQLRKRVIVLARRFADPGFPEPTHYAFGAPGVDRIGANRLPRTATVRDAFLNLSTAAPTDEPTDVETRPISEDELKRIRGLRQGGTMRDLPKELQHSSYSRRANRRVSDGTPTERRGGAPAGLRRLVADEPSKAITSAASRELIHPYEDRPITLRECARIQAFPDSFVFRGTRSARAIQIGNAVPPPFARILGTHILRSHHRSCDSTIADHGQLVELTVSNSDGMSPALETLVDRVTARHPAGGRQLWD